MMAIPITTWMSSHALLNLVLTFQNPLSNSDLVFYTDGSAYRENGVPRAGYAICDNSSITESTALPPSSSAQVAELYALMRAFHLAKGKTITIYTDTRYSFGCIKGLGTLWANWGFITLVLSSSNKPLKGIPKYSEHSCISFKHCLHAKVHICNIFLRGNAFLWLICMLYQHGNSQLPATHSQVYL